MPRPAKRRNVLNQESSETLKELGMTPFQGDPNVIRKPKSVSGLRPTKEGGINPKEEFGHSKVPLSLIPQSALVLEAMAMKNGLKYGPYNFRKIPMQSRTLLEACQRHIAALLDGEDFDPKTGLHHAGFARATLGIYIDCMVHGTIVDNRPLPGDAGALISLFNDEPGQLPKTPDELRSILANYIAGRKQANEGNGQ